MHKRKRSEGKAQDRRASQSMATAYKKGRMTPISTLERPNSTKVGAGGFEINRGSYLELNHKKNHGRRGKKARVVNVAMGKA